MPEAAVVLHDIGDVQGTVAFNYLEAAENERSISQERASFLKEKLTKLHEIVRNTIINETRCIHAAKELTKQLGAENLRLEKTESDGREHAESITTLRNQLKQADNEQERLEETEAIMELQLAECQQEKTELQEFLDEREKSERASEEPLIANAQTEVDFLKREIEAHQVTRERKKTQLVGQETRLKEIQEATENNTIAKDAVERELRKVACDPERISKRTDKFEGVFKSLSAQLQIATGEIENTTRQHTETVESRKSLEEAAQAKDLQLKWDRERLSSKDQSRRELLGKIEKEKADYLNACESKRTMDLQLKDLKQDLRMTQDEISQNQKSFERNKREYRKLEGITDSCRSSISPQIRIQEEALKDKKRLEDEIDKQQSLLQEIHTEVELFIGAFLKQEFVEKEKRDEYSVLNRKIEEMQKELQTLAQQDHIWHQHLSFLSAQREKIARETSIASRMARETQEEVNMRQLQQNDLRKKQAELIQQQKEYSTLYEIVKNERNKYVAHIQACEQQLAEMKERHKVLSNEVDILKMESMDKDRTLAKTRISCQRLHEERDRLRTHYAGSSSKGNSMSGQVEQHILEIDKLNSIINVIEKEMVQLKRSYEIAVEARNYVGIQLIDRNDELCILWEKSNMQEKFLKKGQHAMLHKDEEFRVFKRHLEEVARQLHAQQKVIPQVPLLTKEALELRQQLADEKNESDRLSQEFEKPSSDGRKFELSGENPDSETIQTKLHVLDERLNSKKEALLEKELVLDELTSFTERLRHQVLEGRGGTMHLSQKARKNSCFHYLS
eukprot:GHVS01045236.1.p1 GENE.GHVS01045236.1~~GHVS01045236.1.p1  ORF type:complete len:792 (+),score=129.65 GHVS01045236.1:192-2567(+)